MLLSEAQEKITANYIYVGVPVLYQFKVSYYKTDVNGTTVHGTNVPVDELSQYLLKEEQVQAEEPVEPAAGA